MAKYISLTGNEAAAHALRQANPDVAGIYPITPQTEMMHTFAGFIANGQVDTEAILVESEHSSMSACVGASAAGARNPDQLAWEIGLLHDGAIVSAQVSSDPNAARGAKKIAKMLMAQQGVSLPAEKRALVAEC